MSAAPWTKEQADLLLWLAKEDTSLVGECIGEALRELHASGYVRIMRRTAAGNATIKAGTLLAELDRVSLTGDGWRRIAQIRQRLQQ